MDAIRPSNPVVRTIIKSAAGLLVLSATLRVHATGSQGYPGANGKPFQAVQTQIDNLGSQIGAINTQIVALDTRITSVQGELAALKSGLQIEVDGLADRIATLSGQLASLTTQQIVLSSQVTQLTNFKNGIVGSSCAPGSSIRRINSDGTTVCEIDTGNDSTTLFNVVTIPPATGQPVELFCPATSRFISGGYSHQFGISISAALPLGNGYSVQAFNSADGTRAVTVLATCSSL